MAGLELQLPPQPKPADFVIAGKFEEKIYRRALAEWRDVCERITVEAGRLARDRAFWNGV